jgi:formiminotetrahydrofolate cyclodeaminase
MTINDAGIDSLNDTLYEKPFSELIELACSKSHVPGGGSVTAMSGALGASMGAMVANLTLGKKGYEERESEVKVLLNHFLEGIAEIKKLTQEDMDSFDALLKSYRLPRETDSQKEARREAIRKDTIQAAMIPLKIASLANNLLFHNSRLSVIGNGSVVNDCAVAAILLESAVRAAMLSVDVNFENIDDPVVKEEIRDKKEKILSEAKKAMEDSLKVVASRDKRL